MTHNLNLNIWGGLLVLLFFIASCENSENKDAKVSNEKNQKTPSNQRVDAVKLKPQELERNILTTGSLLANEEVVLRTEISGRVRQINFNEGSQVEKGQLLLKIDDSELQAQRQKISVSLRLATQTEERRRKLLDAKGISQEAYDEALNQKETLEAELNLLDAQIAKTVITAPFSGIIGLREISLGSYVSPADRVATLQQIDPIKLDFSVPEKHLSEIKKGMDIHFTLTGNAKIYDGKIYAIEPQIDTETRSLRMRAILPNKENTLKPGAFAEIRITLETFKDAIVVPSEALVSEITGQKVYLLKNGKVQSAPVETGIRNERTVQVTKGIEANDTLIITGLMFIKDGMNLDVNITDMPEVTPNEDPRKVIPESSAKINSKS
ncbi:MAG: efflux RND transporter periplasmic adaptor subunit [Bernardetiaceae bacterium]|nr:efflux RND transporter periplasmic adaptor subunit [Bernardetiaceae bacterium]